MMNLLKYLKMKKQFVFIGIVLFQVLMLFYVGTQKKEYHIDEIYSYILSNSYDADKISNADWMWGEWIEGSAFDEFITVQEGERFAYQNVYHNNSTDCHPPLYYWILHSVCSFFPNQFSQWFGLGLNIVLYAVATVLIYLISTELIKSDVMRFLPLVLYGFSKFAVDTVVFIRMYMLLELFALLFIHLHVRMFKYGITAKRLVLVWLTIFLGAMTQYYAIILSFWGVLLFSCYLLKKKDIKQMLIYGFGSLVSVILMLFCYPYAIVQATGSSTNNIGNEVVSNLFNIKLWVRMTASLAKSFVTSISYHPYISYCVFVVLLMLFISLGVLKIKKKKKILMDRAIIWMAVTVALVFLSISFVGGEYVYLRYIYYIIPLMYIIVIAFMVDMLSNYNVFKNVFVMGCVAFALGNAVVGTLNNWSSYLFESTYEADIVLQEQEVDVCFVVQGEEISTAVSTGNLTKLSKFDSVFMDTKNNICQSGVISTYMESNEQCIVYVCTDKYWTEGLVPQDIFKEILPDTPSYSMICRGSLGEYYLVEK